MLGKNKKKTAIIGLNPEAKSSIIKDGQKWVIDFVREAQAWEGLPGRDTQKG